jgi:hypothetical protein
MKRYIRNITGESEIFPKPQILAYNEKGKGNVAEKIKKDPKIKEIYEKYYNTNPLKYKDYVLIHPGEQIETELHGENVLTEPRFKVIVESKGGK